MSGVKFSGKQSSVAKNCVTVSSLIVSGRPFSHGLFGQAAAQLGAAFEGGLDKGHGAIVLTIGHRTNHLEGLLVLRRAQKRDDALKSPVVERALILELQRANGVRDVFERVLDRVRDTRTTCRPLHDDRQSGCGRWRGRAD